MINDCQNKELAKISDIKGVMMALIVLYHSCAFWLPDSWFIGNPKDKCEALGTIAQWLNLLHIYVFTYISGYLFAYNKFEKGKYQNFKIFLWKKVKRLLIPYILIGACWAAPFYYLFYRSTFIEVVKNFLLGYAPAQLWYILMLFNVFIIVYPFSSHLMGISIWRVLISCGISYSLYIVLSAFLPLPFQIVSTLKFIPYFIFGMRMRKRDVLSGNWWVYLCGNLVCFIILINLGSGSVLVFLVRKLLEIIISSLGILFIINFSIHSYSTTFFEKILSKQEWYNYFKNNSFTVYLIHQQIIWIIIFCLNGRIHPIIISLICFLVSMIVSLLISYLMNNFKLTRFMIGRA